jgi:hypothetical protein
VFNGFRVSLLQTYVVAKQINSKDITLVQELPWFLSSSMRTDKRRGMHYKLMLLQKWINQFQGTS